MEKFKTIFLIAGLFFFALSVVIMAVLPWLSFQHEQIQTVSQLSQNIPVEFVDLAARYPENFKKYYGEVSSQSFGKAIDYGNKVYIREACWHCHSQFIRPVSSEDVRWGAVSEPLEYQNVLQMPQLFGTRRVGPDLIREFGRRSNDWHAAHFYEPRNVAPTSVMPSYRWFFDEKGQPNKEGLAIISYMQWLGSGREVDDKKQ